MNMIPPWITPQQVDDARAATARKGTAPALANLRFEAFDEGLAVQTLHVGPFDAEATVLEELHSRFIPAHDLQLTGRHHEIYLSDPRRSAPEKLRTILRQPVLRQSAVR